MDNIKLNTKSMSIFERYLTLWVGLCIIGGIALGKFSPGFAKTLDGMAIYVGNAPVVSIPIAVCLFFMMYPIMVKIDFASVIKAGKSGKPVGLTLFVNWAIKPFTMYAIALFFLGTLFYGFIGPDAVDNVKMPFGLDLPIGATHGAGQVVLVDGIKMLQVPLWRSYLAGCILLGIAPCTAMVLVWGYLAKGNDGLTLVMVAINSLTMLLLYGVLGGFLLGVGRLPVPWQALLLSIAIYVALPLVAGFLSRKWIIAHKGKEWFEDKFLHVLTPITIIALLATLVLLFSFKGEVILSNPLTILWIAIPLFIQTNLIFWLGYGLARLLKLNYKDAAPAAMIGASNHFEVAIATSVMLFGLSSGAALATVVGVLIAIGLAMDAFAVSIATGATYKKSGNTHAFKMAFAFGGFQAIMPVIGWFAGLTLREFITDYDHWVAFILLAFIGGKMIYESFKIKHAQQQTDRLSVAMLLVLAIATSIDALAVGITFSFLLAGSLVIAVIIIGLITFAFSYAGFYLGKRFGHFFETGIEALGGLILLGIGTKILLEHLVFSNM